MRKLSSLLFTLFLVPLWTQAESIPSQIVIVTAQELAQSKEPYLILDARSAAAFREGRIPGSQHVDWKNWTQEQADVFGLWFGKPTNAGLSKTPDDLFQNKLRKLGLSNTRPVLVVGDASGWGEEGRIAWNLLYWGIDRVAMLDGGYAAWAMHPGNRPEIGHVRRPARGDFVFRVQPERSAGLDTVQKILADKTRSLVDNRSAAEFNGKSLVGQKRAGHIPGAASFPVENLYSTNGFYIDKSSFIKRVEESGIKNPVAYCAGGVRSALFAMLWEAYFGEIVANYEGSMWEWSARPDLPLE